MLTHSTKSKRTLIHHIAAMAMVFAMFVLPAHAGRKPNFGLYVQNYFKLVSTCSDWLIHPTNDCVTGYEKKTWKKDKRAYDPYIEQTQDMDTKVMEMRERGYVMIGYAAFSTTEARDPYITDEMSPAEISGTRLGLKLRGIDPYADPLGDPRDAAIWANAETVIIQRGYSFSRLETQKDRILADESQDKTRIQGSSRSGHRDRSTGYTKGQSNTKGGSTTDGSWDSQFKEAHADVGTEGGNVGGSLGDSSGNDSSKTNYGEQTTYGEVRGDQSRGSSFTQYDDTITAHNKHWATALIDEHVDHYDYMVTYWKKVDPNKVTLGAITTPLSRELRAAIGTRHARMINAVTGGTPAYDSDLWEGDVVLAIGGEEVRGESGYQSLLSRYQGQEIPITVWREGQVFDVPVRLNQPY